MGLFRRKSMEQRQADAMHMADNIAQGKGVFGKMTRAFMGKEFTEAMESATSSMRQTEHAAALRASGVPTMTATVVSIQDTGQTVNDDPHVVLTVDLGNHRVPLATLVQRLEIPRVGDKVLAVRDPRTNALLYAGPSYNV